VRGYKERGSINTPLDLAIENTSTASASRGRHRPRAGLKASAAAERAELLELRDAAQAYAHEHGVDEPGLDKWAWPY
jgi:xylulose-5-phosphate/fructose-6-phosphate phosphoketolase